MFLGFIMFEIKYGLPKKFNQEKHTYEFMKFQNEIRSIEVILNFLLLFGPIASAFADTVYYINDYVTVIIQFTFVI